MGWAKFNTTSGFTLSNGDKTVVSTTASWAQCIADFILSEGSGYVEFEIDNVGSSGYMMVGVVDISQSIGSYPGDTVYGYGADSSSTGTNIWNGTSSKQSAAYTTGSIVGVAIDADNNTLQFLIDDTLVYSTTYTSGLEFSLSFGAAAAGIQVTMVSDPSLQTYEPPSGISAGFGSDPIDPSVWTPASGTPLAWFDANDADSITIDVGVSLLSDKSGNGYDLVQDTDADQPTYNAAEKYVDIDGADGFLEALHRFGLSSNPDVTILAVVQFTSFAGGNQGRIIEIGGNDDGAWNACYSNIDLNWRHNNGYTTYSCSLPTSAPSLVVFTHAEGDSYSDGDGVRLNGSELSRSSSSNGTTSNTTELSILGYNENASSPGYFRLYELIILNTIDADEVEKYEGYVAHKWDAINGTTELVDSLPVDHLYKTEAPQTDGDTTTESIRNTLVQSWELMDNYTRAVLQQVYGLRMLAMLKQPLTNAPQYRRVLVQNWASAALIRQEWQQDLPECSDYRNLVGQDWDIFAPFRNILMQRYHVSEKEVRAICREQYDLLDRDALRAVLDQIYVLAAGEALVQVVDTAVYVDNDGLLSVVYPWNIHVEQDEDIFHFVGELQLADQASYDAFVKLESLVRIIIDGEEYHFTVEEKTSPRGETTDYQVVLAGRSLLLDHADSAYSTVEADQLSGLASQIVKDLAAPVCDVDWQMADGVIPPNRLYVEGATAMACIKTIVHAGGGIVQEAPGGGLICREEEKHNPEEYETDVADLHLTDQDDFFQVTPSPSARSGYNRFYLTDQQVGGDGVSMQDVLISATRREVRVYLVPWSDSATVLLHHSGGSHVQIVYQGVVTKLIEEEDVEFKSGAGGAQYPVYSSVDVVWKERDLGGVTGDEDKGLTADVSDYSLADISYYTKYHSFIVIDNRVETVQVYPEVIDE